MNIYIFTRELWENEIPKPDSCETCFRRESFLKLSKRIETWGYSSRCLLKRHMCLPSLERKFWHNFNFKRNSLSDSAIHIVYCLYNCQRKVTELFSSWNNSKQGKRPCFFTLNFHIICIYFSCGSCIFRKDTHLWYFHSLFCLYVLQSYAALPKSQVAEISPSPYKKEPSHITSRAFSMGLCICQSSGWDCLQSTYTVILRVYCSKIIVIEYGSKG